MRNETVRWLLVGCGLLFFWLAVSSLVDDTPTMDEQNHIARGVALLRTGDPRLSLEHPPLVNALSALPLLTLDLRLPTDDPSWERREGWYAFADLLLWQYNVEQVDQIVFLARLPIVFLTLLLALVGYQFGRILYHTPWAGLITAFLLLFDPNIMAHGRYSTTDIGGTAFLLLATLLLWRMWQAQTWRVGRWLWAALGLGLAFGSKLSVLTFVPIWGVLALLPLPGARWRVGVALRRLLQFVTAGALSLVVIWALFVFQWGPLAFVSPQLDGLNRFSGPMPTFWAGIEQILFLSGGGRPGYLFGRFSDTGFLAYFPVAFAVKTPLPTLIFIFCATAVGLWHSATRRLTLILLVPALLYFGISLTSALNIGYRHLFPMLPFLYLLVGGLAVHVASRRAAQGGVALLLGWLLLTTATTHPHYIGFFNVFGGGSDNGYTILSDSNVDWGQDLRRLEWWMWENGVEQVRLSYFGSAELSAYPINYTPLPGVPQHFDLWWNVPFDRQNPEPGTYAISAANLGESPLRTEEKTVFAWFRARQPDARVGSFFIYEVR